MDEVTSELLTTVQEIRDLIRLLAEPAIAERDRNLRSELRRVTGSSRAKARSVFLMDGSRTQTEIHRETGINQGQLSTFIKQLSSSKLLVSGEVKQPKLAISIPANFFENGAPDE